MRKPFLLSSLFIALAFGSQAQSFSVAHDTVRYNITGRTDFIYNNIIVPAGSPVTLKWTVVGTNFPTDWKNATGICDNQLCYPGSTVFSSAVQTSSPYIAGASGDFHVQFTGTITSAGTYYVAVKLYNEANSFDTKTQVYVLTAIGATAVQNVAASTDEISVYPNPATNEINILFGGNEDIKTIALYNNIGKLVSVYKTTGISANLNLETLPSGLYFARMANDKGEIVATRRFTKQ